jgi:hypothetical protein
MSFSLLESGSREDLRKKSEVCLVVPWISDSRHGELYGRRGSEPNTAWKSDEGDRRLGV